MSNASSLQAALDYLFEINEFQPFLDNYISNKSLKSINDLEDIFKSFKRHLLEKKKWKNEYELVLKIAKEKAVKVHHEKSKSPLFVIDPTKKLNDNWIQDFQNDIAKCVTGEKYVEEVKPGRYKTITENIILEAVDGKKLSEVYSKYSKFNHPYVNYQVASVLHNAKNFSSSIPILKDGIKSIASYPHHYWDNEMGIEGATWLLSDLLYLLGDSLRSADLKEEKTKLFKLLFLHMSRYICMTGSNVKSIDYYANRARIVRDNQCEFIRIFGVGVTPDIQFISDMYLAYQVGVNNQITGIPSVMQFLWESKKMYEHGSHIPNNTAGYRDIEDRTWMDLVNVGEIRSINLANKLLNEFENYQLNISDKSLKKIFQILLEKHTDEFEEYSNSLLRKKLNT